MMKKCIQAFPHVYQHAEIVTRPATRQDYYVPDQLKHQCIVVERTVFKEKGCINLSCFPYKSDGTPCEKKDPVKWIAIGNHYSTLSCQPSCWKSKTTVDSQWIEDKCMAVNPLKKLLAIFPEKAFGLTSKHELHSGLDWKRGNMYLNKHYCAAYGLEFDGNDCYSPTGQTILEYLLGKTVYRAIKTSTIKPVRQKLPPVPKDLEEEDDLPDVTDITKKIPEASQVAEDIASEMAFDFGIDLTTHVVEKILRKKAPKLILKAAANIPVKSALVQAVVGHSVALGLKSVALLGKALSGFSNIFAIYSIFSVIMDVIDPYNYDSVLTADMLEKINKRLDFIYFRKENVCMREITPEIAWDTIFESEDESDRYEFMAEKISEYLKAIQTEQVDYAPKESYFSKQLTLIKQQKRWSTHLHVVTMGMLGLFALVFIEWIHVWAVVTFFAMVLGTNLN